MFKARLIVLLTTLFLFSFVEAATFTVSNLFNSGAGSFRQAIISANGTPGADIINFSVSGTIAITGGLPGFSDPVTIDGSTAPGYVACGAPVISLDGGGGSANGMQFFAGASGSSIIALNVRNFQFNGIQFIGSSNNTVRGCYIGTDASGNFAASNGQNGVQIEGGGTNNIIGGSGPCDGNVIGGNNGTGIAIITTANTIISGNHIGVGANGTSAVGNSGNGIYMFSGTNTVIGGTGANDGNVIGNQNFVGIIVDNGSNNTRVEGNIIGANAAGTAAMGNGESAVLVINSSAVSIGGATAAHRNILSGSITGFGAFFINSDDAIVQNNYIGTDITGTQPIPNDSGGVYLQDGSNRALIGGTGAGNVIAFNDGHGIGLPFANVDQALISENSIFCNTGKGIDLGGLGNANYASPTFTSVTTGGVTGLAAANDVIELYYDSTCAGNCQGKNLIATVTANGAGNWSYTGPIAGNATLSATARSASNDNTSEFTCFTLLPVEGLAFSANVTSEQTVELSWSTLREENNRLFEVERSADGVTFTKIGERTGQVDDPDGADYEFTDLNPGSGVVFYRLKQLDLNGSFTYSDILSVNLDLSGLEVSLFPQPASQNLFVRLNQSEFTPKGYEIRNLQGKMLTVGELVVTPGSDFEISVYDLANGVYFLTIKTEGQPITKRFQVLK